MILGDIVRLGFPTLKEDVDEESFTSLACEEVIPLFAEEVPGAEFHLYKADRGDRAGEYMTVWTRTTRHQGDAALHPPDQEGFGETILEKGRSQLVRLDPFLASNDDVTDFALIGSDQFESLYPADIIGVHFLQVEDDQTGAFETFVREKLHPAFKDRMPGMPLLWYKGVHGTRQGSYVLIFAIETVATREAYFPTGAPETDALKEGFLPLESLGKELVTYLKEGTWLDPSSGAPAAYFESLEWTDFVHVCEH